MSIAENVTRIGSLPRSSPFNMYSRKQFRELAQGEPEGFLVESLFPSVGISLLVGAPYAGKTQFMLGVAAAMSFGKRLAGLEVQGGTVLYCYLEHNCRDFEKKLRAVEKGFGAMDQLLGARFLKVIRPAPFMNLEDDAQVQELAVLAKQVEAKAIVIDSLRRAGEHDENLTKNTETLRRALDVLVDGRRAVIGFHHTNRQGDTRGTTDFDAFSDSMVFMTRKSNGSLQLDARHHEAEQRTILIQEQRSNGALRYARLEPPPKEIEKRILEVMATGPQRIRSLQDAIKCKHDGRISRAVHELAKRGQVKEDQTGKWVLV
jgi:RecA-family ATPase